MANKDTKKSTKGKLKMAVGGTVAGQLPQETATPNRADLRMQELGYRAKQVAQATPAFQKLQGLSSQFNQDNQPTPAQLSRMQNLSQKIASNPRLMRMEQRAQELAPRTTQGRQMGQAVQAASTQQAAQQQALQQAAQEAEKQQAGLQAAQQAMKTPPMATPPMATTPPPMEPQGGFAKGGLIRNKGIGASMKPHNVFGKKK